MLATDFYHGDMPLTAFGRAVEKIYKGKGTTYAILGVEAYALLRDAMNRCDDPEDRDCLNDQIRSTRQFTGVMGYISMGADGKAERPLVVNAIRNREMKYVIKVY
jgi:branched-chain amino acid transport system substrate-binding protein